MLNFLLYCSAITIDPNKCLANTYILQIIGRNGGEDTLAHWPTTSGVMTIDEACCEVLKYLDKVWGSLSSSGRYLLLFSFLLEI